MDNPQELQLRKQIIDIAKSYIGATPQINRNLVRDMEKYTLYRLTNKPEWCAYFAAMCWLKSFDSFSGGSGQLDKLKKMFNKAPGSTRAMLYRVNNKPPVFEGTFTPINTLGVEKLPEPKEGDMIFFRRPEYIKNDSGRFISMTSSGFPTAQSSGHVGLVEKVEKNSNGIIDRIITIEGNTTGVDDNGQKQYSGNVTSRKPRIVTKGDGVSFPREYWIHGNYFGIIAFVPPILTPGSRFDLGEFSNNNISTTQIPFSTINKGKRFTLEEEDFTSLVNRDIIIEENNN